MARLRRFRCHWCGARFTVDRNVEHHAAGYCSKACAAPGEEWDRWRAAEEDHRDRAAA